MHVDGPTPAGVEHGRVVFGPVTALGPQQREMWSVTVLAREAGDHRFGVELTSELLEGPVVATEATRAY